MTVYRFHAAAPPGEWLNDPNDLHYDGRSYVLHAQHSAIAPHDRQVGWGRFRSDDLLVWAWDGVAVPPDEHSMAYSGSVIKNGGDFTAFFTRHDPARKWQSQWSKRLDNSGSEVPLHGADGRNCRDPFVFEAAEPGQWRMLVANPCDWTNWSDERSRLSLWSSGDMVGWSKLCEVGPWHPPGVLWEVPVVLNFGGTHILILSLIDRREGLANCSVRYWVGRLTGEGWSTHADFPVDGLRLDHGPDFYAAIPNLSCGWPSEERHVVGWASNWARAASRRRANGSFGGPISLPRVLSFDAAKLRLRQAPPDHARHLAIDHIEFGAELRCEWLTLCADRELGKISVDGGSTEQADWLGETSTCLLFRDEDVVEAFISPEGFTVTKMVGRA